MHIFLVVLAMGCHAFVPLAVPFQRGRVAFNDAGSEAEELKKQVEALREEIAVMEAAQPPLEEAANEAVKIPEEEPETKEEAPEDQRLEAPKSLEDVNALFSKERCVSWCKDGTPEEVAEFAEAMGFTSKTFKVSKLQVEDGVVNFEASQAVHRFLGTGLPAHVVELPALQECEDRLKKLGFFTDIYGADDFDLQGEMLKLKVGRNCLLAFDETPETIVVDPVVVEMDQNFLKTFLGKYTISGASLSESLQGRGVRRVEATMGELRDLMMNVLQGKEIISTRKLRELFGNRIDDIGRCLWRRWRNGVLLLSDQRPINGAKTASSLLETYKLLEDPLPDDATIEAKLIAAIEQKLLELATDNVGLNAFVDVKGNWNATRFTYRASRAKAASLLATLDLAFFELAGIDEEFAAVGAWFFTNKQPDQADALVRRAETDPDFRRILSFSTVIPFVDYSSILEILPVVLPLALLGIAIALFHSGSTFGTDFQKGWWDDFRF